MNLQGCSTKPIIKTKIEYVFTPDSLLVQSCDAVEAGTTVRELAEGYVHNTLCVRTLQNQLNLIIEYNKNKIK